MDSAMAKGFADELEKLGGISSVLFKEPANIETDPALDRMGREPQQRARSGVRPSVRSYFNDSPTAYNMRSHVGWTGVTDDSVEAPSRGLRS